MSGKSTFPRSPIAIVGMSSIFPGSHDTDTFWRNIINGIDQIREVPPSHWLVSDYYDADPKAIDKTYCKGGAYLSPIAFNPLTFGIPPTSVPSTDTCQLLALIAASQVLADAAKGQKRDFDRSRISVFLGVASGTELLTSMVSRMQRPIWAKALRESGIPEPEVNTICDRIASNYVPWQESSFPGLLGNVVAGRITNRLDLGGANCVVDAACASSLSALFMGLNDLYLERSDMVITGGVDALNEILMYMCFSKTPAFSPTGDCRPFSEKADGTMIGEGVGMFALRRLEDAERDGNTIHAVIRGVGAASDGKSTSVYAPKAEGQALAVRRAYAESGGDYTPDTVELLEAHGTGTKAGDAAEFAGIRSVFADSQAEQQWCALGTIKSQIGHTKAAAGSAGMLKAAMALANKVLPCTIKVERPNPKLNITESPFYLNTETRPWIRGDQHPRRAGVSSFGFGGSNYHVLLEEYTGTGNKSARVRSLASELVLLSANTPEQLAQDCQQQIIETDKCGDFMIVARKSQECFDSNAAHRLAIVASNEEDLKGKLKRASAQLNNPDVTPFSNPAGIHFGQGEAESGKIAFLFPGQGSQYLNMGADLAMAFDSARDVWDCAASMQETGDVALHRVVFPVPAFSAEEIAIQDERLTAMECAQPGIAAVSLSQLALLEQIGVKPDCTAGHSFGEVTALFAAKTFDTQTTLQIAKRRGELMNAAAAGASGAMTAVLTERPALEDLLKEWQSDVVVANHNSPKQVVLSGATDAIADVEARLKKLRIRTKRLSVASAFHSKIVSSSSTPFAEFLDTIAATAPTIPVYANATAMPYPSDIVQVRAQLSQQLAQPVRFVELIDAMYADGVRTFVEVGPGHILTGLVEKCLHDRAHVALNLDHKKQDGITSLWNALGRLAIAGKKLNLAPLWEGFAVKPKAIVADKHALMIQGSNYKKPYPPEGGESALPKPNLPKIEMPKPVAPPLSAVADTPIPESVKYPETASVPTPVAVAGIPAAVPVSSTIPPQHWAATFKDFQEQTANAHTTFQETMAESHQAFLNMAEKALAGFSGLSGPPMVMAGPELSPPMFLAESAAPLATGTQARVMSPPPSTPFAAPAQTVQPSATATHQTAPPAVTTSASKPTVTPSARKEIAEKTAVVDLQLHMLEVVADKTGYPIDMLELDMELEAGLGIDSIKRVEILSAFQERVPGLPEIEPNDMASLNTLGEIVDFMQQRLPSTAQTSVSASSTTQKPIVSAATQSAQPTVAIDLKATMLTVVAEKTGYPVDMLELDMELEAGLGIDSIKRVEILSAFQEQVPGMPEIEPNELASLNTLGEIVDYMQQHLPAVSTSAQPTVLEQPSAELGQPAVGADLKAVMLAVVAEKTGYPADMLELDMELEAGLGIDSIKRVEILSAFQEQVPGLPEIEPNDLAALNTLGQIVDYMQQRLPAATAAVPAHVQLSAALEQSADLKAIMLAVVAEKTGYPADMLELDMELEAGLGIDSIKRVEILSAFQEQVPGLPEIEPNDLAALNTLGQIVDFMQQSLPASTAAPSPEQASISEQPSVSTDLKAVMLSVVAEKTGYPADMLELDMELEAGLGIDSIKRVEILSAFQEQVPGLPEIEPNDLASLTTLGQIVDYMQTNQQTTSTSASASASASAIATTPPVASVETGAAIGRFSLTTIAAPATGFALPGFLSAQRVVVTSDGGNIATAVVDQLNSLGIRAELCSEVPVDADVVLFLGGLHPTAGFDQALTIQREAFLAAKAVAKRFTENGGIFVTLQDSGGDFGVTADPGDRAWIAGLPGLVKTAALEWPNAEVKAIDIERGGRDPQAIAVAIVNECLCGGPEIEVGLSAAGSRVTLICQAEQLATQKPATAITINQQSVFVVSGGARGVTAATLIALAQTCHPRFVLLGRTPLQDEPEHCRGINDEAKLKKALLDAAKSAGRKITPIELGKEASQVLAMREIHATVAQLQAAGSSVRYVAVDVRNHHAVTAALTPIRQEWGPVTGLIHAAGMLADKRIQDKQVDQFERVFATKVEGLNALLTATKDDPLQVVCLFSSVAARGGNVGQCDYAMGNEVLNKVAQSLSKSRKQPCLVKSINWGPWDGGMVTPALKAHFSGLGIDLIPLAGGARFMVDEFNDEPTGAVEIVAGGGENTAPPLLGNSLGRQMQVRVDSQTYPYLASHTIEKCAVVPMMLVAEWFMRAARACFPQQTPIRILDLQVLRGIQLQQYQENGDVLSIHVAKANDEPVLNMLLEGSTKIRHYSAKIAWDDPKTATTQTDSMAAHTGDPWPFAAAAAYVPERLFHGPDFHVIKELQWISENSCQAVIHGVNKLSWPLSNWIIDVAALDGGLQLAILWGQHQTGKTSLPTRFASCTVYRQTPVNGAITCQLHGRLVGQHRSEINLVFVTEDKQVCMQIDGLEMHFR